MFANPFDPAPMMGYEMNNLMPAVDQTEYYNQAEYAKAQLAQCTEMNANLQQQLQAAQTEMRRLYEAEVGWHTTYKKFQYVQQQLKSAAKEVAWLREESEKYQSLRREYDYLVTDLQRLKRSHKRYLTESESLRGELSEAEQDFYRTESKFSDQYSRRREDLRVTLERLQAAEVEIKRLNDELAAAMPYQKELRFTKQRYAEAQEEIDHLNSYYKGVMQQLSSKWQEELSAKQLELDETTARANEMEADNNYLRGSLQQHKQKSSMAVEQLEKWADAKEMQQVGSKLSQAERQIIHLKNIVTKQQLDLDRVRSVQTRRPMVVAENPLPPVVREIVYPPAQPLGFVETDM